MKRLYSIRVAFLLVVALLVLLAGCKENPATPPQGATTPAVTEPTAPQETEDQRQKELADKYISAVEAISGENYALEVTYEKRVTLAGQTYWESGTHTQDYRHAGTEDFTARVKSTVVYGSDAYEADIQETYGGGKVYQKVSDGKFCKEMTAEEFIERHTPVQMLEPALYTLSANEAETVLTFATATAAEAWCAPEDAELLSASGSAELDGEGKLLKTTYTVSFRYGAAEHTMTYTAIPTEMGRDPAVPEKADDYVVLDYADAAVFLEHAYGYLSQARHVTSNSYNLIVSAAAGYGLQTGIFIDAYAEGEAYAAKIQNDINAMDYTKNESESYELTEKFVDGKYTASEDGGKETPNSYITQTMVESAVLDKLLEWIVSNEYIADVKFDNAGGTLLMEYTGTEKMAEDICYDICGSIFNDGDLLNDLASSYTTDTIEFYLALDAYSLLPTAVGMLYEGTHVIDGYPLTLTQQVNQSFDLGSMTAYEEIFEEPAPEEEPENPATPLFYHVTGQDGQEMWLLGTIHVGDARTAYLPDEIYDAFYSADAFAIECNVDAFDEQVEEDEELQEKISDMYYYSDGTTVADHIDTPDLYDAAKSIMKASGNYYFNSEYQKAHLWANSIENYYLRLGYSLTSEKGVENRLLKLAEKEDIPVWEVESVLFQIEMTANFSEDLQEFMLFGDVSSDASEYWEGTRELYELWCSGDEAALIEEIAAEDPWVIEEEDIDLTGLEGEDLERAQAILADLENINAQLAVLQEEYNNAMSYDRNEGMLEVAKEYLESGDVVFYAVGLAHLLADNGLVNSLREAGYTVELVKYQ